MPVWLLDVQCDTDLRRTDTSGALGAQRFNTIAPHGGGDILTRGFSAQVSSFFVVSRQRARQSRHFMLLKLKWVMVCHSKGSVYNYSCIVYYSLNRSVCCVFEKSIKCVSLSVCRDSEGIITVDNTPTLTHTKPQLCNSTVGVVWPLTGQYRCCTTGSYYWCIQCYGSTALEKRQDSHSITDKHIRPSHVHTRSQLYVGFLWKPHRRW